MYKGTRRKAVHGNLEVTRGSTLLAADVQRAASVKRSMAEGCQDFLVGKYASARYWLRLRVARLGWCTGVSSKISLPVVGTNMSVPTSIRRALGLDYGEMLILKYNLHGETGRQRPRLV